LGNALLSAPKTDATHNAPETVITQPITEFHPKGARLAGSKNTPDPIMLPMTKASVIQNPMGLFVATVSCFTIFPLNMLRWHEQGQKPIFV
jgi:hypothetical protein